MIDELAEAKLRHPSSGMLQEVIASNAVRAYNEGFERGAADKMAEIIKLLESKLCWCVGQPLNEDNGKEELMKHMNCDWEAMMIEYHVSLIKGEQK